MLKTAIGLGQRIISLTGDVQRLKEDTKRTQHDLEKIQHENTTLREEMHQLQLEFTGLIRTVERLNFEYQRDRERWEERDRTQKLELEVLILRHLRGLPPTDSPEPKTYDAID